MNNRRLGIKILNRLYWFIYSFSLSRINLKLNGLIGFLNVKIAVFTEACTILVTPGFYGDFGSCFGNNCDWSDAQCHSFHVKPWVNLVDNQLCMTIYPNCTCWGKGTQIMERYAELSLQNSPSFLKVS